MSQVAVGYITVGAYPVLGLHHFFNGVEPNLEAGKREPLLDPSSLKPEKR